MKEFDVIVIGSGSALIVMEAALAKGLSCALIENSKFGGTCLTRGCIPSKILTYPADVIMETRHAGNIGLEFELKSVNWDFISARMWKWINKCKKLESNLDNTENLTVFKGTGEFTGIRTLRVLRDDGTYTEEITAQKIIIGAGARSMVPAVKGLSESGFVTYETFFGDQFPKKTYESLAIIGGGTIGVEFAHIFSAFGTKVTLAGRNPHLVPKEEEEVSDFLETQFKNRGIEVLTNYQLIQVDKSESGKVLTLFNADTGEEKTVVCEEILVASGLSSNAGRLMVSLCGVETDEHGWIKTDEFMQTSVPGVWALGDINGKFQFRHKANYEAEIVAKNLFGDDENKRKADYSKVPWAIYTYPQIAHAGLTETQARESGEKLFIGKKHFSSIAKGSAMGYSRGDEDDGFVKIIADKNRSILGVHIIGSNADILVQAFVYLMNAGYACTNESEEKCRELQTLNEAFKVNGTFSPVFKSMVIHPSLSELTAWVLGEMEWS